MGSATIYLSASFRVIMFLTSVFPSAEVTFTKQEFDTTFYEQKD